MKCLKCGFVTSESKQACTRCGSPLPRHAAERETPSSAPVASPPPVAAAPTAYPAWRREVTRKVKEYGEKKKSLTTPAGPLKEAVAEQSFSETEEPPSYEAQELPMMHIEPPDSPPFHSAPEPLPVPYAEETSWRTSDLDVSAGDFNLADSLEEEDSERGEEAALPMNLKQRGAALAIDSAILIVLHCVLLYACSLIINYDFRRLLEDAWPPLLGAFLLFHCIYYVYFYKTSRQTPGQVFFKIELRDPLSGSISLSKVLTRWAAMVFLNVFNLAPLLMGRRYLLLDHVSGTEIRPLR